MKFALAIVMALIFVSCTPGLNRKYNKTTRESDLISVSEQISAPELELLKNYISELETSKQLFENKTYLDLLVEAKEIENVRQQKIQKEIQIDKQKIESENLEKTFQLIKKLLCAKKWKITEYAFQVELPDDSEENVLLAKNILNKLMYVENSELIISVFKEYQRTIVRGKFDAKMLRFFTNNGKRFKQYFSDGTFKDQYGDEVIQGTWKFISPIKIQESRPTDSNSSRNKQDIYILDIKLLDENSLNFYETKYDPIHPVDQDSPVSSSVLMKH